MKKTVAFLTAFVTAVICCSCSNSTDSSQTEVKSSSSVVSEKDDTSSAAEIESCKITDENFNTYVSNTYITTGNNGLVKSAEEVTYRVYLPVEEYGELEYCFYFSNTVDSTYKQGQPVYVGEAGGDYTISSACIADGGTSVDDEITNRTDVTFDGEKGKEVSSGETYWSDPVTFDVPDGHYLVWEWTLTGENIPSTYTSNLTDGKSAEPDDDFAYCDNVPQPQLIGAKRENVKTRVTAIGDSITQGCMTEYMKYEFWAAGIAKQLDADCSFWNCGLGWSRSSDLATCGNWLGRALNSDVVIVAFGTNDISSGEYGGDGGNTAQEIDGYVRTILDQLKAAGCKVILFNSPPQDYTGELEETRLEYNELLKTTAEEYGAEYFDFASYLCDPETPATAKYGGHPNGEGGKIVADAFMAQYKDLF